MIIANQNIIVQEVLEQYEKAIKYYNKAVELYPNDTYYNRGVSEENLGLYDEAIKLNNNDTDAYNNKGFDK
ncbi:tetratricopeptide repeat protein [Brachyspira murdochii]|uniref:TPR repeat-containing protein n=1 Tax=Brachyspira murdochii TaxID=84378 RepID=A0ABX5B1K1_9SPIR|nr:tetratricopeptide repeat protein [Brachyspira murdochii]PPS21103.1 hypothetical protein DJ52_12795 [Brachyspira murdochii]